MLIVAPHSIVFNAKSATPDELVVSTGHLVTSPTTVSAVSTLTWKQETLKWPPRNHVLDIVMRA